MHKILILFVAALALIGVSGSGQSFPAGFKEKVEEIVLAAYQSAAAEFPCKLKSSGRPSMLHRQDADRCLNAANDRVDWENLSRQLKRLQQDSRIAWIDISAAVEASLAAHAVSYQKVFTVKDSKALLPLTNSLLKFLPPNSLQDIPVFTKSGEKVGMFAGTYTYDKSGGLSSATSYQISIFQYTDLKGNLQAPAASNRLLLDRYGVPWKDAMPQSGFRLTPEKLLPSY
jgi:hypothetical protein